LLPTRSATLPSGVFLRSGNWEVAVGGVAGVFGDVGRRVSALATIVLVVLVAVLGWQNRDLRAQNDRLVVRANYPRERLPVPPLRLLTLAGDSAWIAPAGQQAPEVLFFFTTTCGFCKEILPTWKAVTDSLRAVSPADVRVYGIGMDSLAAVERYVSANGLNFPVAHLEDRRTVALYRSGAVPLTAVVGVDGRYSFAHLGAIKSPSTLDSLYRAALATGRAIADSVAPGPESP
jgi:thiol-disulfide isomerase/thioredoxin